MSTTGLVMTVTDELLAELDTKAEKFVGFGIRSDTVARLVTELRRLRAENAELAKDAGRYRFLRDLPEGSEYEEIGNYPGCWWDESIDTAMATQ